MKDYENKHSEFMISLYNIQLSNGLYFLHEHPAQATSWKHPDMVALSERIGKDKVIGDM